MATRSTAQTSLNHSVNRYITDLPTYNAGQSTESVKRRYNVNHVVRLGSNENPYGPSPRVAEATLPALNSLYNYPDAQGTELITLLADSLGVLPDQFILGNGSEELIALAARALLNESDEMVTVSPDFGLHTIHTQAMGASVYPVPFNSDYSFDVDSIITALQRRPTLLCISSPSNPVGTFLSATDIERILAACHNSTVVLFDEAYYEYASLEPDYPDCLAMLEESSTSYLLLRTFSKAYGLAGLRIGYGVARDESLIINYMNRIRTPFNVNQLAQVAAIAAYQDQTHMQRGCELIRKERFRIAELLSAMGYDVAPSSANFLFVNTGTDAQILSESLMANGVIVKPWLSEGFTTYIRVTIGTPVQNNQFITAIESVRERLLS